MCSLGSCRRDPLHREWQKERGISSELQQLCQLRSGVARRDAGTEQGVTTRRVAIPARRAAVGRGAAAPDALGEEATTACAHCSLVAWYLSGGLWRSEA